MQTLFQEQTTTQVRKKDYRPDYVFVAQLHDGRYIVGQASNPSRRLASINSGYHKLVRGSLQINRVIGIREQNEERSFAGVVNHFCAKFGNDQVIAV